MHINKAKSSILFGLRAYQKVYIIQSNCRCSFVLGFIKQLKSAQTPAVITCIRSSNERKSEKKRYRRQQLIWDKL